MQAALRSDSRRSASVRALTSLEMGWRRWYSRSTSCPAGTTGISLQKSPDGGRLSLNATAQPATSSTVRAAARGKRSIPPPFISVLPDDANAWAGAAPAPPSSVEGALGLAGHEPRGRPLEAAARAGEPDHRERRHGGDDDPEGLVVGRLHA